MLLDHGCLGHELRREGVAGQAMMVTRWDRIRHLGESQEHKFRRNVVDMYARTVVGGEAIELRVPRMQRMRLVMANTQTPRAGQDVLLE